MVLLRLLIRRPRLPAELCGDLQADLADLGMTSELNQSLTSCGAGFRSRNFKAFCSSKHRNRRTPRFLLSMYSMFRYTDSAA